MLFMDGAFHSISNHQYWRALILLINKDKIMSKVNWSKDATKIFKGKVVSHIEYTSEEESREMDWQRTPVIVFTDGSWILASGDDEGNRGGSFWTSHKDMSVIPTGGW
jgi:hypothetical protein